MRMHIGEKKRSFLYSLERTMCMTGKTNVQTLKEDHLLEELPSVNTDERVSSMFENPELIGMEETARQPALRNRGPQKPGLTIKGKIRHFVQHQYTDHANDPEVGDNSLESLPCDSFPIKLHLMLSEVESLGLSHVVSWFPHGRAFGVHKPKAFVEHILSKYFSQTKLTSFQRQLSLYGFTRLSMGPDRGGYYNERFLRGKALLARKICRTKVKGTQYKATSSPDSEPDFYTMPFVTESTAIPEGKSTHVQHAAINSTLTPLENRPSPPTSNLKSQKKQVSRSIIRRLSIQNSTATTLQNSDDRPCSSHTDSAPVLSYEYAKDSSILDASYWLYFVQGLLTGENRTLK